MIICVYNIMEKDVFKYIEQKNDSFPSYRIKQVFQGMFDPKNSSWDDVLTLPKNWREQLKQTPWIVLKQKSLSGRGSDTCKALLTTHDNQHIESVLMPNSRGDYTICLSAQIGCAMGCRFCATGAMGFKRNLSVCEIFDQYRFWQKYLHENESQKRISNLVFMGMGEPLANYENVKQAINTILEYTDIGSTKITVSTVGLLPVLSNLLSDNDWPPVRLAVSLHAPDEETRKKIMPSCVHGFHKKLAAWTHEYAKHKGNRNRYLTFEYIMIDDVNDSDDHARQLAAYFNTTAAKKINLIPYNQAVGSFRSSSRERIKKFQKILCDNNIDVTVRQSLGSDITAACGQLAGRL